MFASDDVALAAAVEAYLGYLEMSSSISSVGGRHPARILEVAGSAHAEKLIAEFRALREAEMTTTGTPEILGAALHSIDASRAGMELDVCLGVGDRRVLDAAGDDVTPNRPDETPLVVRFIAFAPDKLIVTGSAPATDEASC